MVVAKAAQKKAVQKKVVKKVAPKAKIVKKAVAKANPRRPSKKSPVPVRNPTHKAYYTVGEDAKIIEALQGYKKADTKTSLVKTLMVTLSKTEESLRNRIKRYIRKLTPADQKEILKAAAQNPKQFVHFHKENGVYRKIDKFSAECPSILHLGANAKKSKKTVDKNASKKKKPVHQEDLAWLATKLKNNDPYFQLENQVYLLNSIFQILIEKKIITEQ